MALAIYPYQKISELYQLKFVDSELGGPKRVLIVTPNPQVADLLRSRLDLDSSLFDVEVVTIANFIKKQLQKHKCPNPVLRKADIMLHFSTVWSKYFAHEPFSLFQQAYEIFSDWRSYSLQLQNFEEALESLEPVIKKAVIFFWTYIENAEFFDEHGAYQYLATVEAEKTNCDTLVFYGFTHLSGVQLGMLQNFSDKNDILIPVASQMLEKIQYSDWIAWIQSDLLKTKKTIENKATYRWKTFESTSLNQLLKNREKALLVLGANDQLIHFSEVHSSNDFFKLAYDFLTNDYKEVTELLQKKLETFTSVKKILENIANEKSKAISEKKWGKLKVYELYEQSINFISDVTEDLNHFYFAVIQETVNLNLPRTYVVTLKTQDNAKEIYKSDYLWAPDLNEDIEIVVKANDSIFVNKSVNYTANVYKVLATLGPVQRMGLRAEWLTEHLKLLLGNQASLLIDEELLETNAYWKKFLKHSWDLKEPSEHLIVAKNYRWEIKVDSYKKKMFYSPSEIQTYLDCPRKYYVNYVESFEPKVKNEFEFAASDIGEFEHDIIRLYFENNDVIAEERLFELCNDYLKQRIQDLGKKIDLLDSEIILDEIVQYTFNALSILMPLKKLPNFKYFFEKEFVSEPMNIKGRIDLFFTSDSGNGILDFKRNKVPTQKDVFQTENVQLWSYLFGLNFNLEQTFIAYMSLSEPENSWGFGKAIDNLTIKNIEMKNSNQYEISKEKIHQVISHLKDEKQFEIKPRKTSVCLFCPASFTCDRGSLN